MNNLFITYQVKDIEKNQEELEKAIASLGNSTKLHTGSWYINSEQSTDDAIKYLGRFLTDDDILIIADTTNNESVWFNLEDKRAQRIRQNWKM